MTMDKASNLYAGGTLGIVDASAPIHKPKSKETFGIARLNPKTKAWEICTNLARSPIK
jgi:hypothetical protein